MIRIAATAAKNNFGGLLELVARHGRVEITKHGRVVAVVLDPRVAAVGDGRTVRRHGWGETHMIPRRQARRATMVREPEGFDA